MIAELDENVSMTAPQPRLNATGTKLNGAWVSVKGRAKLALC
jgi:hypothetical protein